MACHALQNRQIDQIKHRVEKVYYPNIICLPELVDSIINSLQPITGISNQLQNLLQPKTNSPSFFYSFMVVVNSTFIVHTTNWKKLKLLNYSSLLTLNIFLLRIVILCLICIYRQCKRFFFFRNSSVRIFIMSMSINITKMSPTVRLSRVNIKPRATMAPMNRKWNIQLKQEKEHRREKRLKQIGKNGINIALGNPKKLFKVSHCVIILFLGAVMLFSTLLRICSHLTCIC